MFPDIGALLSQIGSSIMRDPVPTNPGPTYGMGFDPSGNMPLQGGGPKPFIPDPSMLDVGSALSGQPIVPFPSPPRPQVSPVGPSPTDMSGSPRSPGTGAPMNINPMGQEFIPSAVGTTPNPVNPGSAKPMADRIVDALKGVKAPASPELQRISTPPPPRPTSAIKSGDLMALLAAMSGGGGGSGPKLPSTRGAALRG